MSGYKRPYKNYGNKRYDNKKTETESPETLDSKILQDFKKYQIEIDSKNDRYERLVKISRDVTIESKRIIFLLHTIDSRKNNKDEVLKQAQTRLMNVIDNNFKQIARELVNLDQYLYARAYSAGLQEFIEAFTYHQFLSGTPISGWKDIQAKFTYETEKVQKPTEETTMEVEAEKAVEIENSHCFIQPVEYILGLADLTGEVMRNCINSLGSGNTDSCFDTNKFLQKVLSLYMSINPVPNRNKDLSQKIFTLKQSTLKTENVCYNLIVRGTEKASLIPTDNPHFHEFNDEEDEGYF